MSYTSYRHPDFVSQVPDVPDVPHVPEVPQVPLVPDVPDHLHFVSHGLSYRLGS